MAEKRPRRIKGDGSIKKRPDNSWEGRIPLGRDSVTGKRKYKYFTGKTMKEVKDKMRQYRDNPSEIVTASGKYVKLEETARSDEAVSFGDWLNTWLTLYKVNSLRPSTYERYRLIIENHIKPVLGGVPVSELTTDQIQRLLTDAMKEGSRKDGKKGSLTAASVIKIKTIVKTSLEQAKECNMITLNPANAAKGAPIDDAKILVLSPKEQDKLIDAMKGHRLEALFKIALATGMRKGEILALTWEGVNFEERTITISKTVNRISNEETKKSSIITGPPKSKASNRTISMLPSVIPILEGHFHKQREEMKKGGPEFNKLGLVFCSKAGGYIEPRRINRTLDVLIEKAGLEHISFHSLRHTFATRALESGVHVKIVQSMLGHKKASVTLDTYSHLLKDTLHAEMQKMNDVIANGAANAAEARKAKKSPDRER